MSNPNEESELDDIEVIEDIMEAYDLDEERARELWGRFKETVRKMSEIDQ